MANGLIYLGATIGICTTPQNADLTQVEFAALTYAEICCPTEIPEVMEEAEIISEFCISGEEQTARGASAGAETEIPYYYKPTCAGQTALRNAYGAIGTSNQAYAFKITLNDGVTGVTTPTTIYFRAIVTSKALLTGGGVNDLVTSSAGIKIAQPPILVLPAPV